ncbi:ABC transporter substrate-binding protein [Yinghuangia sp. ASG 101]|uniref:ABC transporter substrate-binding protein n=1 Tax=Yinghuangia sp. ASG 101 TaxID=2896848 RepID=UPI001E6054A2|nr:ABC transporter substrate-binding protein [Yinghuangia sp. ASG 101]UGQ12709.1 ABC transporter substrate-binding protein [Yinghuangia sp. ASG 101]
MRPTKTITSIALVAALFAAAGCADRGGTSEAGEGPAAAPSASTPLSADFGDLKNVCGPGDPKSSPAQGVTAKEINVGVMSDVGFTKNHEYEDAAKVFTSWCNELGGINGRKVKSTVRDTKMVEVRQRMTEACREDFALVGGSAALDAMGTKDRLSCLLPEFPSQSTQRQNEGSDLQLTVQPGGPSYFRYAGFYEWLVKDAYPQSAGAVGIIAGDSPVTKVSVDQRAEFFQSRGTPMSYTELYPAAGVSSWTPYAQNIKNKGVKGLIFMGDYTSLAKLEQELTAMDYKLDWIDANSNAYGQKFLGLAGDKVLNFQNNLADISGTYPLENGTANPATKQVLELFAKYAPNAEVTLPGVKAFSSWLLFAKSAASCGDDLTRKCLVDAARKETAWTGGGLQAPIDLSAQDAPAKCMNIEKATADGWKPAPEFQPSQGAYTCDIASYKLTGDYGKPGTLADVGKSLNDLK